MKLYCPENDSAFEGVCPDCGKDFGAPDAERLCPRGGGRLFTMESRAEDPMIGTTIDGRFRIDRLLGQGGMGAVYRGVQLSVNRDVAVKVLRRELTENAQALERFYRESKIISGLSHPNIVRLIDFGQEERQSLLYLVMELVEGLNLGDLLERGRLRVALALEIVYQVCGALTEPHAAGVIHRDLKPDNLLLVPISDGTLQVKVLDFGIARALEQDTQLTATGMAIGTPQYMAPEQAQNDTIDARTDLYALGVMLYEMLCGMPPFAGQNSLQVMIQQIQVEPPPLSQFMPPSALPEDVERLVHQLLSKRREARPASAREVRDRIDAIRRKYDLDPVRLGAELSGDAALDAWLLPSMPDVDRREGGHTQALRRETGMERAPSTHSTGERQAERVPERAPAHTPHADATAPVTEARKEALLRADAGKPALGGAATRVEDAATLPRHNAPTSSPTESLERSVHNTTTQQPAATSGGKAPLIAAAVVVFVMVLALAGVIVALATGRLGGGHDGETTGQTAAQADPPVTTNNANDPVTIAGTTADATTAGNTTAQADPPATTHAGNTTGAATTTTGNTTAQVEPLVTNTGASPPQRGDRPKTTPIARTSPKPKTTPRTDPPKTDPIAVKTDPPKTDPPKTTPKPKDKPKDNGATQYNPFGNLGTGDGPDPKTKDTLKDFMN